MTPLFNPRQPPMNTGTAAPLPASSGGPASSLPPPMTFKTQDIHTMPGRFTGSAKPSGSGRPIASFMIIGGLALCVIVGGVLLYLRLSASMNTNTNAPGEAGSGAAGNVNAVNTNTVNSNVNASNVNVNANTNSALPTTVTGSLLDADTNEVLGSLTATFPPSALPSTVQKVSVVALSPTIGAYATAKDFTAVGGVFLIAATPSTTAIAKNATLELTYTDRALLNLNIVVKENTLKAASWSGSEWAVIEGSTVDAAKNTVTVDINKLYPDGIAVVAPAPVSENTNSSNLNTNQITGTPIVPSKDSDTDGLTDQEELLYGTNATNADTDSDGYKDGQEVLAHYDPTRGSGAKIADSGLVKTYTNTTYQYSALHPSSWVVGTMNADKLVLFTSITGEFVQISVQDNVSGVSARQWYLTTNSSVNSLILKDIAIGNISGIIGPDNLNIFLADTTHIYQLTYNIGIKAEANYLNTFATMYTSFQTGVTGSGTNSNSNANSNRNSNSNTNANANANTNTNTNANSNSNSNTNL